MHIRKATAKDIDEITDIYSRIHDEEESGRVSIGWVRGIYPERQTAEASLARGDLFVGEEDGLIIGTMILNKEQCDMYPGAKWEYEAPDDQVMVMHTLIIDPALGRHGYGRQFERFYEAYALEQGARFLRIDTQSKNHNARKFYAGLGYKEVDQLPCDFNGIEGVSLILLEKAL